MDHAGREVDVFVDGGVLFGECFRQAGRAHTGDGDGVFSVFDSKCVLPDRAVSRRRGPDRQEPFGAVFTGPVRDGGVVLFLRDAAADAAGVGADDTVFIADIYGHDRDLFAERAGAFGAVDILRGGLRRGADDTAVRPAYLAVLLRFRHTVSVLLGRGI